jgi:AsmA protein
MKRKLLLIAAALVVLLVVAVFALPMLIDAERFRPMVEAEAKAALGRQISLGKLDFSLLSGGVVVNDVSIADDPAFSRDAFLTAKSLKVGVEIWPMITSREVHVNSVSLEQPQINLVRSASGKWNFDSFGATANQKRANDAAGTKAAPSNFSVQNLRIEHGRVNIVQASKKRTYDDVNVTLKNFSNTSVFPFEVDASTPGGGTVKLDGEAGPIAAGDVTQTPMHANMKVEGLDLAATGFAPADSGIAGIVDYDGNVRSDGKMLHSEGKAKAKNLRVVKGGAPAHQVVTLDYASDLDLPQKKGVLTKGDISFGDGASQAKLTGNFDTRPDVPTINARLKGTNMPLDSIAGLLPAFGVIMPQGSQVQGGVVSTDLSLQGPLDKLVTSGPLNVANTKIGGFNLKSRASSISALAGMPSGSDLLIQALNSKLRVAPEGIRADGIELVLPNIGTVNGDGIIGANNSLNFKMRAKLANGGGLIGGMSALSTLGQSKGEIPFMIQGTTQSPVFLPDLAGAMSSTVKTPVQGVQGVGGLLGGFFGKKKK